RLASALAPLLEDHAALEQGLTVFGETFHYAWRKMLADKLGLVALGNEGDDILLSDLFDLLQQVETDMTLFFRGLMAIPVEAMADNPDLMDDGALAEPLRRAFYAEEAFAPAQLNRLTGWLRRYITRACRDTEMTDFPGFANDRLERMRRANPKYVLRNYLAQQAIEALEQGDDSVITRLMEVLKRPYDEQPEHDELADRRPEWARYKAGCSALSCSS
ncbi:MAG: protein adenylyltransferase SelO family protein, partial [Nitrosospira sp.]